MNVPAPITDPGKQLYRIEFDREAAIIRVQVTGFWSKCEAEIFCAEVNQFIDFSRKNRGFSRMLIDRRESPVQAADVTTVLQGNVSRLNEKDWIALVVQSVLLKLQFERVLIHGSAKIFTDIVEAESWLRERGG